MALIISSKWVSSWAGGAPPHPIREEASSFNFSIPSTYLSIPYGLEIGDKIKGEILAVKTDYEEYLELKGKEIGFILYSLAGNDFLFLSKGDWEQNFREYGLVIGFWLSAKLSKAVRKDGTEVLLYTKKDVQI